MQEKLRIYGKCLQNWMVWDDRGKKHITQVELAYTDYDPTDGSVIQTGSEDFSMERYKHELTSKYCYTWNGEDRTEEGYRHFVAHGHFLFRKADLILLHRYLKIKFPKEKRIELRF